MGGRSFSFGVGEIRFMRICMEDKRYILEYNCKGFVPLDIRYGRRFSA
jgi:hypothetical protein